MKKKTKNSSIFRDEEVYLRFLGLKLISFKKENTVS